MTARIHVQSTPSGSVTVLALSGEFDLASTPALRAALMSAVDSGPGTVVIDLADVAFVDSTVLGVLVAGNKRARHLGGRLIAVNVSGLPLKVMTLTGLAQVFDVHTPGTDLDAELVDLLAQVARMET